MLDELERKHIRRVYSVENKSIRQLSREEGLNRITIRKVLSNEGVPYKPPAPPNLLDLGNCIMYYWLHEARRID
jgi:hypothetical protein